MADVRPTHLAQAAIVIRDQKRAKSFYRDKLGLQHLFDAPPGLSFFQCGETRLMLSQMEGPQTAGSTILYYGVADAAEAQRLLAAEGVAIEEKARHVATAGGKDIWLAICRDSEGNLLGLMSERNA